MLAGRPDANEGLFVGTLVPQSMFDTMQGKVVGAEVAVLQIVQDWLQRGDVRRWYHFADTREIAALDRPAKKSLVEHLAPGSQMWGAALNEAPLLTANGFLHALISPTPAYSPHFILRGEAQRARNVPIMGFVHSLPEDVLWWTGFLGGPSQPWDVIVSPTQCGIHGLTHGLERLRRLFGLPDFAGAYEVIPYGVSVFKKIADAREWLNWHSDDIIFLSIARFDSIRKCDLAPLLLAFAAFLSEEPRARLVLAGAETESNYCEYLERLCLELGISARVELRPDFPNDEKSLMLSGADIFIAFSDNLQETYGLAVVEAMAAGLPVIASDFDGFKETVVHGETGFLIATQMLDAAPDVRTVLAARHTLRPYPFQANATVLDIGETISAMRTLAKDPDQRRAMGEAGVRRVVTHFDRDKNHARMADRLRQSVREAERAPLMANSEQVVDWRDLFSVFPSGWVSETTRIEKGPLAAASILPELAALLGTDSRKQLKALLEAALLQVPGPLLGLSETLSTQFPNFVPHAITRHLVRFAKYGFFRLC